MSERGRSSSFLVSPIVLLSLLAALAFLLRAYRLDAQSFWYDEAFTAYYAKAGIETLFRDVPAENHPPLHFLLVQLWEYFVGSSEFSLRYLSLVFGVAVVPLTAKIANRLFPSRFNVIGILAALFLAVSPLHAWYSQEARMYSLATALGLFSIYFLLRALHEGRFWQWTLYVLFSSLGAFSHFYFAFLLVGEGIFVIYWFLFEPAAEKRRLFTNWMSSQIGIIVFLLPLGFQALFVWDANSTYWEGPLNIPDVLRQTLLAFGVGTTLVGDNAEWISFLWLFLYAFGIPMAKSRRDGEEYSGTARSVFLVSLVLVPLLLLLLISLSKPKLSPRYLLFSLPFYYLSASVAVVGFTKAFGVILSKWRFPKHLSVLPGVIIVVALLGASSLSLRNMYFNGIFARDDFRDLVGYVESQAKLGDAVLIVGGHAEVAYDYYLQLPLPVYPLPKGHLPDISNPIGSEIVGFLNKLAKSQQRVWLVLWQSELADPQNNVLHQLSLYAHQQLVDRQFQGLELYLFSLDPNSLFKAEPDIQWKVGKEFDHGLEFLGFDVDKLYVRPGDSIGITLYWKPKEKLNDDLTAFVHLLDSGNKVTAQIDKRPANDFYTSQRWQPGQIVRDEYYLKIPPGTPPGRYTLETGIYYTVNGERLRLQDGEDRVILLQPDVGQ